MNVLSIETTTSYFALRTIVSCGSLRGMTLWTESGFGVPLIVDLKSAVMM
jgi:hypothetical protein